MKPAEFIAVFIAEFAPEFRPECKPEFTTTPGCSAWLAAAACAASPARLCPNPAAVTLPDTLPNGGGDTA
jgi:hypothetical protein